MKVKRLSTTKLLSSINNFLFLALVLGISYTQPPLYTENQNTKFLHGLASAGLGFLREDWLANTIDPLPVFSFLVSITYRYLHESLFYIYYIIFFGVYAYSMIGIVTSISKYNIKSNLAKYLTYLALFVAAHTLQFKLFQFDFSRHFHWGVAKQTVLGLGFQAGTFGVLIILSIYVFLHKHSLLAVLLLCVAATFHPTYLLSAAILTFTYMIIILKNERNLKKTLLIGIVALILVLPIYIYTQFTFSPTSPELWRKSLAIIVEFRIPHHSIPQVWLSDKTAYIQIFIVIYALFLIKRTDLFMIMFTSFITATTLTVTQIILNSRSLAFLAPWRLSAFLVPISTCIVLAHFVNYIFTRYQYQVVNNQQKITCLSATLISIFVLLGAVNQVILFREQVSSTAMMNFVKQVKQPQEVYLIPIDSKNFRNFRLYTGAPIFVNIKSHPYKDVEVIEWYNRVKVADNFYQSSGEKSCQMLEQLSSYKVTHIVLEKKSYIKCDNLKQLYEDKKYKVYGITSIPISKQRI